MFHLFFKCQKSNVIDYLKIIIFPHPKEKKKEKRNKSKKKKKKIKIEHKVLYPIKIYEMMCFIYFILNTYQV